MLRARGLRTLLCFATAAALSGCADPTPDAVDLIIASHHIAASDDDISDGRGFNEVNPGLGLVFDGRTSGVTYSAGFYENSFEDLSVYALRERDWNVGAGVRIGFGLGLATYPGARKRGTPSPENIVPIGGAHVVYGPLRLSLAPLIDDTTKGVLALRIRFPLGAAQ